MERDVSQYEVVQLIFPAYLLKTTAFAFGFTGCADIAAMEDEPMMRFGTKFRSEPFCQVAFYCIDGYAIG